MLELESLVRLAPVEQLLVRTATGQGHLGLPDEDPFRQLPKDDPERKRQPQAEPATADVLLVEDELLVAMSVCRLLEHAGHRIVGVAATAEAAVRLALDLRPSIILMDVTLKGPRDGIDAAAEILAAHSPALIFVTAHSDAATRGRMDALQPAAIVAKPFTDRTLIQTIQQVLGQ